MNRSLLPALEEATWCIGSQDSYSVFGGAVYETIIDWHLRFYWLARAGQTIETGHIPNEWSARRLWVIVQADLWDVQQKNQS